MPRARLPLALALAVVPALAPRPAAAQTSTAACAAIAGNLVQNCGFEGGTYTSPNGGQQPTGYTVTSQTGSYNSFQSRRPHSGDFSYSFVDLAGSSGTLSQALATTPGAAYAITFYGYNGSGANTNNALTVMFDNLLLRTGPLVNGAYQQFTYTGIATSTSTTLAFTGYNNPGANFIDDLSVTALTTTTPEPATWALLGAGLLAVGGMVRRRPQA